MKRKNIFGIVMGIIVVICILMAMVQFKKERITQKDNVTVLPGGVTIKKIEDDEEYDAAANAFNAIVEKARADEEADAPLS